MHNSRGHWLQAVWAHPEHGAVLAILTDTGAVTLYSECQLHGEISMWLVASLSGQHVTALAFGPKELGLQLATAGRNGMVRCQTSTVFALLPQLYVQMRSGDSVRSGDSLGSRGAPVNTWRAEAGACDMYLQGIPGSTEQL